MALDEHRGALTPIIDWIPTATHRAMTRILAHGDKVGLVNTDEFTFRTFFMAAAHDLLPSPRFQTEWCSFDLLVQASGVATVVEFKYYLVRRTFGLDGEPLRYKGGAGPKNESEFRACVHKLRTAVLPGVHDRRLVLVYERDSDRRSRYNFQQSYGGLGVGDDFSDVWPVSEGPLEARVLRPKPAAGL